jgi:uncharacterized protein (TIGR00255 family)
MSNGVPILDTVTRKCKVEQIGKYKFRIILTQGLNRQIRRMSEYLGYKVTKLERVRVMNIELGNLKTGEYRKVSEAEIAAIIEATKAACAELNSFRVQEGAILIADLLGRIDLIEQYRHEVEQYESARVETIKNRIRENIEKLQLEVDNNRLEQEMIFYIEKLDITEEKVRLDNHCNYFREVARDEEAPGRKLGFIAQELGREINTMGSKSNEANMQRLVVKMKDELEKIKEQVLNIL